MLIRTRDVINKIIAYLVLYLMLLTSGHVLSVTGNNALYVLAFVGILILLIVKTTLLEKRSITIEQRDLLVFCVFTGMTLIEMIANLINGYNLNYSMKFVVILFTSFLVTRFFSFKEFKQYFVNMMTLISGIAIIGYAIGMTNGFYYSLPTFSNINNVSYYNGIVFFAMNDFSRGRNIGIFWEPGLFAIMIAIALFFLIFESNKRSNFKLLVLVLALISTYSTTGYILLSLIILAYVYARKNSNKWLILLATVLFVGIMAFFIFFGSFQDFLLSSFPRVFTKLFMGQDSTTARVNSIIYNCRIFVSNILGYGITKTNYIFQYYSTGSQTSTMTLYFAQFGLLGVTFVFLQLRSILKNKDWTILQNTFFIIFWIIANNVEIMTMFSVVYVLFIYFMKSTSRLYRSFVREGQ